MIGLFLDPIWKKTQVGLSDKAIGFVIVWLCDILLTWHKGDWGSFIRNNPPEFGYGH